MEHAGLNNKYQASLENLPETNTLAYFTVATTMYKKCFKTLIGGDNVKKFFFVTNYVTKLARVFIPCKFLREILIFTAKSS